MNPNQALDRTAEQWLLSQGNVHWTAVGHHEWRQ